MSVNLLNEHNAFSPPHEKLILGYLAHLQIALNQEMDKARIAIYCRDLAGLTRTELHEAFEIARHRCQFIPHISELLAFAEEGRAKRLRLRDEKYSRKLLEQPTKPPDWEPMTAAEVKRRIAEAAKGMGFQRG